MRYVLCCCMVFLISFMALPGYGAVIGTTDDEVKNIAEPIFDSIMSGFSANDYLQYSKEFDATLKETITAERFEEIREEILEWIGEYLYREYLGFLNREAITIVFWKGVFDKTEEEILIKMIISERDGQYRITGLSYQ